MDTNNEFTVTVTVTIRRDLMAFKWNTTGLQTQEDHELLFECLTQILEMSKHNDDDIPKDIVH